MPFKTSLQVEILTGGDAVLIQPLVYWIRHEYRVITVPKGFVTDFASIPRIFRPIITGQDNTRKPAVVHDYLYRRRIGTRREADDVFLLAMEDCKVDWWKRWLAWSAVRLGGWVFWRER